MCARLNNGLICKKQPCPCIRVKNRLVEARNFKSGRGYHRQNSCWTLKLTNTTNNRTIREETNMKSVADLLFVAGMEEWYTSRYETNVDDSTMPDESQTEDT